MALQNNITTNTYALKCARSRYFGKFSSVADVVGFSAKEEKRSDDIPYLNFFMEDLNKLNQEIKGLFSYEDDNNNVIDRDYVVRKYGNALIIFVPDFDSLLKKFKLIYEPDPYNYNSPTVLDRVEIFETTYPNAATENILFAANGNPFYVVDVPQGINSLTGKQPMLSGYAYKDNSRVISNFSTLPNYANTLSLSFNESSAIGNRFKFKFSPYSKDSDSSNLDVINSQPTEGDGFGGLTPIIFNDNGVTNIYGGENDATVTPNITGNNNYNSVYIKQTETVGNHLFAFQDNNSSNNLLKDSLCIVINEDGSKLGDNIDKYRDRLYELGYQNVVGMDGSGSTFFYDYCKKKYIVDVEAGASVNRYKRSKAMYTAYAITSQK